MTHVIIHIQHRVVYMKTRRVIETRNSYLFVYYQSINRELKTRPIYECQCDERLRPKGEESTCVEYTGLLEFRS